jgi:hypothetical protein
MSAQLMIERHGIYAAVRARRYAMSLLDRNMPSAHEIWCQVAATIERLQSSDKKHRLSKPEGNHMPGSMPRALNADP